MTVRLLKYFFEYEDPEYNVLKHGYVKAVSHRQAEKKISEELGVGTESFQIQVVN